MTSINPPRDDDGVVRRRLQRAGTAPVGKVRRGAAATAARRVTEQPADPAARGWRKSPAPRDRGPERRLRDRRQRRVAVLLDTRSAVGNRRRGARRSKDQSASRRAADAGNPPAGTLLDDDTYA